MMILSAVVLLICVTSSKVLYRFGVPSLFVFMALGMLFGSDGFGGIYFDDYDLGKSLSSIALVFIMFYGGFGTHWESAKPVALQAVLLSFLGTIITAGVTGYMCHVILHMPLLEGLLIGSVVASTDAASVFAILRSRKLNLKGGLAPLLEVESGSNDPVAFMLTIMVVTAMTSTGELNLGFMVARQLLVGIGLGVVLAATARQVLRKVIFEIEGMYPIFLTAVALLGYSLSDYLGGSGFLCVYIIGIILGNSRILRKKSMVHFFDGISWLMQILLFFTLGLLSFPSRMPAVIVPGLIVSGILVFIARPIATFLILTGFKTPFKQQLLVSTAGLRGAASLVCAIYAVTYDVAIRNDIFHIVFIVALFSVLIQGTLLPYIAKVLDLVEDHDTVSKTFNDYQGEDHSRLTEAYVGFGNSWVGKTIMDANIPAELLVVMIKRGEEVIVPHGSDILREGDTLVMIGERQQEIR